jgi:hypothetical protein
MIGELIKFALLKTQLSKNKFQLLCQKLTNWVEEKKFIDLGIW